jgi:hypothetical protein
MLRIMVSQILPVIHTLLELKRASLTVEVLKFKVFQLPLDAKLYYKP